MSKKYRNVVTHSPLIIWSFITLLIVSVYTPALNGPLVFDDHPNIVENPGVAINDLSVESLKSAFFSNVTGPLKRVLPALSFGINHFIAGGFKHTFVFKITNLMIHAVNTALVFWLALLLVPRLFNGQHDRFPPVLIAAFVALVWGLHPIHMTVVAYVVQRMTSMAGTFVFLGLCLFVLGRLRFERHQPGGLLWMCAGVLGGTALSLMCKENGALMPLYAGVIEFTLFAPSQCEGVGGVDKAGCQPKKMVFGLQSRLWTAFSNVKNRRLFNFYLCTLFIPALAALIYLFIYPGNIVESYAGRPFSLAERLLTEARILWFYLYLLFVPDITNMGLFHDDLPVSTDILTPWTTIMAVLSWGIIALSAVWFRRQAPVPAFAVLWYLAGHSMESTFIPLLLIFEHRNYVPSFGMVVLFAYSFFKLAFLCNQKLRRFPLCLSIMMIAGLYYATFTGSENWRTENDFIRITAKNHPMSPISQYLYGEVLYKKFNNPMQAYPYYYKAAKLEPSEAGFLISVAMVTQLRAFDELRQHSAIRIDPQYIADLLKHKPISAWGLRALEMAGRCVKAKHVSCADHVSAVRSWMQALRESNFLSLEHKRHFTNQLFEIEMRYGLFDDALRTINNALSKDDSFSRFYLMQADVLAALGRYSQALDVLNQAQARFERNDAKFFANAERMKLGVTKRAMKQK